MKTVEFFNEPHQVVLLDYWKVTQIAIVKSLASINQNKFFDVFN